MKPIALALLAGLLATGAQAQDAVSMVGTWTGRVSGAAMPEGWAGGDISFVVTDQQGPAFKGYVTFQEDTGQARDEFVGAVAMDGRTVTTADSDGYTSGFLINPNTLEQCYFEAGQRAKVVCGRLVRRP